MVSTVLVVRVTRLVGSAHKFAMQIARLCSPSAREFKSLCTNSEQNKKAQTIKRLSVLFGPSDETWTHDLLTPSQARYQLRHTRIYGKLELLYKSDKLTWVY